MNFTMKVCGFTFSDVETDSMKTVFENVNDSVRFTFVESLLKSRLSEINNCTHRSVLKSDSYAERCFEASKQLAKENKHRCAVKKLNEALAHTRDLKFAEILKNQREIQLKFFLSISADSKETHQSHTSNTSLVNQLYRGANEEFEAFSLAVKVKISEEFGRHVVTMDNLEPGQ